MRAALFPAGELAGRDSELTLLAGLVAELCKGHPGRAVLIEGEPGYRQVRDGPGGRGCCAARSSPGRAADVPAVLAEQLLGEAGSARGPADRRAADGWDSLTPAGAKAAAFAQDGLSSRRNDRRCQSWARSRRGSRKPPLIRRASLPLFTQID